MKSREKHGMYKTRFYRIWRKMRTRCNNPNSTKYYMYGDRGIKVCERWGKFLNFKEDMYEGYLDHVEKFGEKNTSIERKNNSKGYSKLNCVWATCKEQSKNMRSNVVVKYNGKEMIVSDWARELDINLNPLYYRIKNWTVKRAF